MPYLPDGTYISEEELLAQQQAQLLAHTRPTAGKFLGTNFNFTPWQGGGSLDLGWDQAPNVDAGVIFDQDVGFPYVSGYDASMEGMADLGTGLSDSRLGLTAGVKNVPGSLSANPYIDATISDVVPGLTVGAGTDTTPFASYFGDESSKIPGLGITKFSGENTQASLRAKLMGLPSAAFQSDEMQDDTGLFLNLSTDPTKTNPSGLEFRGTPSDLGTLGRRVWGGVKDLFSPISTAGADASVPEVTVAPSMSGVDYSQALADAGMGTVPTVDVTDQLSYEMRYPGLYGDNLPESGGVHDAIEHIDAIYGGVTTTTGPHADKYGLRTRWKDTAVPVLSMLSDEKENAAIEYFMKTGVPFLGFAGDDIETATTAESMKDVINNMVIMDAKKSGIAKDDLVHSVLTGVNPLIQTNQNINVTAQQRALDSLIGKPVGTPIPEEAILSPLYAAADLVSRGGKLDADDARQMAFQVDEFVDLSTQPTQTVTRPSRVAPDISGPTHVPAQPALPAYSGPTAAERKAQSDAQRKQAMADKKAAADAQKRFNELAAKATQEAAAQAQAASQAQAAQAQAQAYIDFASGRDRGVDQRQLAAAREVLSQIDTFDSGNPFAESEAQDRASVAIDASRRGGGPF